MSATVPTHEDMVKNRFHEERSRRQELNDLRGEVYHLTTMVGKVQEQLSTMEVKLDQVLTTNSQATEVIDKVSREVMPTINALMENPMIQTVLGVKRRERKERRIGQ